MNDIVKSTGNAVGSPARRGFEEPTQKEDLIIPRATLLQALSPDVVEGDLKAGQIINSLTKEILPDEFTPIFKFTNWIRFNPRNDKDENFDSNYEPGAIIWRSIDPLDPKVIAEGKFGDNGSKPLATKFLNFFCMFEGVKMPLILSFSKTSFKAGKQLLSLAQFSGGDMFSRKYKITSQQEDNGQFKYYIFKVAPIGIIDDTIYKIAEGMYNEFAERKDIQIHDEVEDTSFDV